MIRKGFCISALAVLLVLCFVTSAYAASDSTDQAIDHIKVNGETVKEDETVDVLSTDRITVEVETGDLTLVANDEDKMFNIDAPAYQNGVCTISMKAKDAVAKQGTVRLDLYSINTFRSQFRLHLNVINPTDAKVKLEIREPNLQVVLDEGSIRFVPGTGLAVTEEEVKAKEELLGLEFFWTITGGNVPVEKTIDGREGSLSLKEGIYAGVLSVKNKYGELDEQGFNFQVANTDPGNNLLIDFSRTPRSAVSGSPIEISLVGSYADADVSYMITIPEENKVYTLPYKYDRGTTNNQKVMHTFYSSSSVPEMKKVEVAIWESGKKSASETERFEIEVKPAGSATSGVGEAVSRDESHDAAAGYVPEPEVEETNDDLAPLPANQSAPATNSPSETEKEAEPSSALPGFSSGLALMILLLSGKMWRR